MITLFVALYSLLCLCTTVKPSELRRLHMKTVKLGGDAIMQCDISAVKNKNTLAWYRQSGGKLPQFFARQYGQSYTFVDGMNDSRFSVTVNNYKFDLNINNLREDDGGEYFCGEVDENSLKLTSGTRLQFEGVEMKLCPTHGTLNNNTHSVTHQGSNSSDGKGKSSDMKNLHVKTIKLGEDVTMECNINGLKNKNNLAWYRQSFGNVPQVFARPFGQSYTFVEGFNDSRFSVTVKDHKIDLNIYKTREDDGGEYFCGYVEGTTLKFTSGTRLQFEGKEMKLCRTPGTRNKNTNSVTHQGSNSSDGECSENLPQVIALIAANIISVIVIVVLVGVLLKHQRKGASSSNHQTPTNQTDDVLNYAAVSFAKKPSSSRTSRDTRHQDVYAQVKIQ